MLITYLREKRPYTTLYDFGMQQSHTVVVQICPTTDSIGHVVCFNYATCDTTRLYANIVLQVSI